MGEIQSGYLHRTDLTAKIPDFIKLAESKINRKLRLLLGETESTLTATIGSRLMAVPTRFGSPIELWDTTNEPRTKMLYMQPDLLSVTTTNGASEYYTVDGAFIATENPADVAYTYTLRYQTKFNLETTSTNTILDNYPDIYVYGALLASIPFTRDYKNFDVWNALYSNAIDEAMTDSNVTRRKALLRTEFAGSRPNILRGY